MKFEAYAEIRNSCAIYVIHKLFMRISFVAMRSKRGPGWAYADIRENGFELHKIFRLFGFTRSMRNLRSFHAILTRFMRNSYAYVRDTYEIDTQIRRFLRPFHVCLRMFNEPFSHITRMYRRCITYISRIPLITTHITHESLIKTDEIR